MGIEFLSFFFVIIVVIIVIFTVVIVVIHTTCLYCSLLFSAANCLYCLCNLREFVKDLLINTIVVVNTVLRREIVNTTYLLVPICFNSFVLLCFINTFNITAKVTAIAFCITARATAEAARQIDRLLERERKRKRKSLAKR